MRERLSDAVQMGRMVGLRYTAHRGSLAAGGLAFFVSLSLAPAAVVTGWIAGLLLDPQELSRSLQGLLARAPELVSVARPALESAVTLVERASSGAVTITSLVSLGIALYAASRVVYGTSLAVRTALGVPDRHQGVMARVAATAATLVGLLALVGVIVALTVVPRVLGVLGIGSPAVAVGSGPLGWLASAGLVWLGCWALMRRAAGVAATAPGPVLAAGWIVVVSAGVGLYVQFSGTLGAAVAIFGSAVVVLMWLYLCFAGLLMGAEIEGLRAERARAQREVPHP